MVQVVKIVMTVAMIKVDMIGSGDSDDGNDVEPQVRMQLR
jgi:hypothetical protein